MIQTFHETLMVRSCKLWNFRASLGRQSLVLISAASVATRTTSSRTRYSHEVCARYGNNDVFVSGCLWGGAPVRAGYMGRFPCVYGTIVSAPGRGCSGSLWLSNPLMTTAPQTAPTLSSGEEPFASLSTGPCQAGDLVCYFHGTEGWLFQPGVYLDNFVGVCPLS